MLATDQYRMRQLRAEDAEAAACLIRSAFAKLSGFVDPPPSALRETAEAVASRILEGGGAAAEATAGIVGVALWTPTERGLYVSRVSVAPRWRGRGIARALLEAAETAAVETGLPALWLSVRLALTHNRRLFSAAGYVETTRHAHEGHSMPTYVDMEKHLTAKEPIPGSR